MTKRQKITQWIVLAAVFWMFCYSAQAARLQEDLAEKVIRIHIVANSDEAEDQAVKLYVRDCVLELVQEMTAGAETRAEALAKLDVEKITACAEAALQSRGKSYGARSTIRTEYFPSRDYEALSLPAGDYLSFRIVLGAGRGHNFWCVMFPPLCTTGALADCDGLSEEEKRFVTLDGREYVIKFKLSEAVGRLREALGGG